MSRVVRRNFRDHSAPPGVPKVDLLPPAVIERRRGRRLVRRAWVATVVAGAAAALAVAMSVSTTVAARLDLERAQEAAASIAEQEEEHTAVKRLLDDVARRESAIEAATSRDADWNKVMSEIRSALPADVTVSSLNVVAASVIADLPEPPAALPTAPMATVEIAVRSKDIPAVTHWIDQLTSVAGYMDAFPSTTTEVDGTYLVMITLHLDDRVLKHLER